MQLTVTFKVPREPYLVFLVRFSINDEVILSIGHFRAIYPRLFESSIDIVFVARSNTLLAGFSIRSAHTPVSHRLKFLPIACTESGVFDK